MNKRETKTRLNVEAILWTVIVYLFGAMANSLNVYYSSTNFTTLVFYLAVITITLATALKYRMRRIKEKAD